MRNRILLAAETWEFLSSTRKLWLLPLVIAMLAIGGLLAFAQTSALAPFIYTLF
ncbi:MAG: DUF5989 family protein [Bryobacteraceae bacterium]